MKLTLCSGCGVSVDTDSVFSWRNVDGGRKLFWRCGECDERGFLVLSSTVLGLLSGRVLLPVDEGLVKFFADELEAMSGLGDVLAVWRYDELVGVVPKDRVG